MPHILGIDIGTQSVKTGIFDTETCRLSHIAGIGYYSGARQKPAEILNATYQAIAKSVSLCGSAKAIKGIGFSGQMHGTVLYDAAGNTIGDIINWQDESGNAPLEKYGGVTTIGHMLELMSGKGTEDLGIDRMSSGFMGATLFYLKENEPEVFDTIAHALFPTDFVRRALIGGSGFETDPTNGFSAGVFNTRENKWHDGIISCLGLPREIFPSIRNTSDIAGKISAETAERTGLPPDTPVAIGGGDNQMSMIGSGAFSPGGPLCLNIGTSSQLCAVAPEYTKIDGIDTRSFIGGNFALVYAGLTGGKCYTWLRNILLDDLATAGCAPSGETNLFHVLDELAGNIPRGCDGLSFLPTLRGTRRNPAQRGAFTGIGENNFSLGHRARAIMEGVAAELKESYNLMNRACATSIAGAGNGIARSRIWREIAADVFGMPLNVTDMENAVCGAAITAAVGIGLMDYNDIKFEFSETIIP